MTRVLDRSGSEKAGALKEAELRLASQDRWVERATRSQSR